MANHIEDKFSCLLISIEAHDREALFDCYRDYLVFMSLVRDGVRNCEYKVYGFCWLKNKCLMIIQPENEVLGKYLLKLLKRYHFWLLQRGPSMSDFKLQILELTQSSWILDCLRYLHQQPVNTDVVNDAMDYHWHSHHVYNGFWSMYWLDTSYILEKFATNRLVAMNRFRQYMLHQHHLDYGKMLDSDDCSQSYINMEKEALNDSQHAVAEVNSHYHQSLLERTQVSFQIIAESLMIRIQVMNNRQNLENEQNISRNLMKCQSN